MPTVRTVGDCFGGSAFGPSQRGTTRSAMPEYLVSRFDYLGHCSVSMWGAGPCVTSEPVVPLPVLRRME
jgi:hypothetical protein